MEYRRYSTPAYLPGQTTPFRLSRSKLELFIQCQRCFWLDVRRKISRPSSPPFNINKAIDELFKKEFDFYRAKKEPHPLMAEAGIKAVPYAHDKLNKWRQSFGRDAGIDYLDELSNLHIFGAVDDIWINEQQELIIVDYKATAKAEPVKSLGAEGTWHDTYRRQMEIYQWLFKKNKFKVSDVGYFVYATGSWQPDKFNNVVEFETHVFPHKGKSDWVDGVVKDIKQTMDSDDMPAVGLSAMGGPCEFCSYARRRTELTFEYLKAPKKVNKKQ